jgi:hypothetical protein
MSDSLPILTGHCHDSFERGRAGDFTSVVVDCPTCHEQIEAVIGVAESDAESQTATVYPMGLRDACACGPTAETSQTVQRWLDSDAGQAEVAAAHQAFCQQWMAR